MQTRQAKALFVERRDAAIASDAESSLSENAQLESLYRREAPRLIRFFRRRIGEAEDAPDLVQESFTRLASFMERQRLANPAPYLQRIARNLLFERTRRRKRQLAAFHLPIGEGCEPVIEADQGRAIEEMDIMRLYREAVDQLPAKTRAVFLLHRVDELTYREIGERLGISIPTVQYHIARSLAQIDAALENA